MAEKEVLKNNIYKLALDALEAKDQEKHEKLLNKLSLAIAKEFENSNTEIIEGAITQALDEQNSKITNLILDEANLEIELLSYEDDNNQEYDSVMQLMPFNVLSRKKSITIPPIEQVEKFIAQALLEQGIINRVEQFHLGTIFLSQEDVDSFSLQDWWNTHRDIIQEPENEHYEKNKQIRSNPIRVKLDKVISMFYFVPVITYKENEEVVMEKIYDSHMDVEFWQEIGHSFSSEDVSITLFPPMGISESMENTKYIMQDVEFNLFFEEFSSEKEIELGYVSINDAPDDYVVLFFDGEDHSLHQFYRYETNGDSADFISMLVEKCINAGKNLYSFEKKVDMDTLNEWSEQEESVDLSKLMKESNQIDLAESFRMCRINHPSMDNENTNQTIH